MSFITEWDSVKLIVSSVLRSTIIYLNKYFTVLHNEITRGSRYSRMGQVKFVEDSFKKNLKWYGLPNEINQ